MPYVLDLHFRHKCMHGNQPIKPYFIFFNKALASSSDNKPCIFITFQRRNNLEPSRYFPNRAPLYATTWAITVHGVDHCLRLHLPGSRQANFVKICKPKHKTKQISFLARRVARTQHHPLEVTFTFTWLTYTARWCEIQPALERNLFRPPFFSGPWKAVHFGTLKSIYHWVWEQVFTKLNIKNIQFVCGGSW